MTELRKKEIFEQIASLFKEIADDAVPTETPIEKEIPQKSSKVELLTIKECTDLINGLSTHTVRQLVKQGKVKSVRSGFGKNGKILVNKKDILTYFAA